MSALSDEEIRPDADLEAMQTQLARATFERDRAEWELGQRRLEREALEQRATHLEIALNRVRPAIAEQRLVLRDLRKAEAEFAALRNSDPWLAFDFCARMAVRILPAGSLRRRAVAAVWRAARPIASLCVRIIQGRRGLPDDPDLPADFTVPISLSPGMEYTGCRGLRKVVFLIGCLEGQSKRYRVKNLVEALEEKGVEALIVYDALNLDRLDDTVPADLLVLFRAAWSDRLGRIVSHYRVRGAAIVFDVDDYVFDRRVVPFVDPVQQMNEVDRATYIDGVDRYRQTALSCDHCTTTTDYLAEGLRSIGKSVSVIPNTINAAQLELSEQLMTEQPAAERIAEDLPVIGYLSGTFTHDKDFLQAADALIEVLAERDVVLCIVGELALDERFDSHADRIVRHDFMPYLDMLRFCKGFTINIAPLEIGNPFNEGKSELKIFEPGLVGVSTVASGVDSYSKLIRDGETGFIARTTKEWKRSILTLLDDSELRTRIGGAAREQALEKFLSTRVVEDVIDGYLELKSKRDRAQTQIPLDGSNRN